MPGKISLQFKFGLSYILVILAVLLLLNTYPLLVSQNLVFRTKQTAMVGSVKIAEAALSGLADLTEDNVAQAMSAVEETGVSRVLVTDTAGRILYDTREGDNARGLYAFYTEIAQALRGNDTFYCRYDGEAFLSRGASPVVYHNQIVGAVYAYEYDTVQAELLRSFQTNIMRISLLVALFVLFLSALLSRMFTRRISDLLQAIRQVREGAYSHRAKVTGSDEIAQLAVQGPLAMRIVQRLCPAADLGKLAYYTFVKTEVAGIADAIVSATGYTGAGGCEIYVANEDAPRLWEALWQAGERDGLQNIGLGARDTLRLEMGYCLYGNDIDDTTSPVEAGLGWITKTGGDRDFIDRPLLERQKREGVSRRLVGFELTERGVPRHGYRLADAEGRAIGSVTSGTMSPTLKKGIGMGYVETAYAEPGTPIAVVIREKPVAARIVKLPFIPNR